MTEQLADKLKRLCCAETEGKFFDCVTDNIDTIIAALRGRDAALEEAAQYHDKEAADCRAIALVNLDNDLGADSETHAIDHEMAAEDIRALKTSPKLRPFYGAECPSYPNCSGGCGLGCTHEIEGRRAVTVPNGERK